MLLALVALLVSAGAVSSPLSSSPSPACDLACWLGNVTLRLGQHSFPGGQIQSFSCTGLKLTQLESAFRPPYAVQANVSGVELACNVMVKLDLSFKPDKIVATSNGSTLNAQILFSANASSGLVDRASLTCDAKINFKVSVPNHPIWQVVADIVVDVYGKRINTLICSELKTLVDTDLTSLLQGINSSIEPFLDGHHPPPVYPDYGHEALNFTGSALMGLVDFLIDDLIGANGPFGINSIVSALTNKTGSLLYDFGRPGKQLATIDVASLGNVTFGISQLSLSGLDTFQRLDLAVPRDSYSLDSRLLLSNLDLNVSFFVNTTLGTGLLEEGYGQSLFEAGELRFHAGNLSIGLDLAAGLDAKMLRSLTFDQLLSTGCLKDTVLGGNLTQARLGFILKALEVTAASDPDNSLERSLDALIDNVLLLFITSYNPVVPAFVNAIVLTPAILAANSAIDEKVFGVQTPCLLSHRSGESSAYALNQTASLIVVVCAAVLWIGVSAIMLVLHCVKFGRSADDTDDEEASADDTGGEFDMSASGEKVRLLSLQGTTAYDPRSFTSSGNLMLGSGHVSTLRNQASGRVPIGLDPRVWWIVKLAIPFLIIGNIGMFITSNVSVGASVFVYIHLGGDTVSSPSLFSFTLANSVHDMWVAGVYPLSLVIAIFSGAWPYAKLLAMLAVWLFPIRSKLREQILIFLDMMGKWSLIDAFVLVFMMVAFRFNLVIPASTLAHTSKGDARIDLLVEAGLSFYLFLLATMSSLVLTHVILAVHRWIEAKNEEHETMDHDNDPLFRIDPIKPGHDHSGPVMAIFQLDHVLGDGSVVKASALGTVVVTSLLVLSFGLVLGGALVQSFIFHFRGAAGAVFPYAGVVNDRSFSLVSLAMQLPGAALSPNGFGVRWVQATLLLFSLVVPLSYLLMLLLLWLVPMQTKLRGRLFVLTEVLRAWSAMEVFVLAVIAALTELEKFAQFLVGGRCDFINPFLAKFLGPLLDGDAKCFDVTTTLADGCWLMFSACVLYIFTGQVVMTLVHEAIFPKLSGKEERSRAVRFLLWCGLAKEVDRA